MKPHIQKKGGVWWCGGAKGRTPKMAYSNHKAGIRFKEMYDFCVAGGMW
tara:strand:+ start:7805 stop:7951 length:147 start_codon:yes stop_codon:yes gene_type:complete